MNSAALQPVSADLDLDSDHCGELHGFVVADGVGRIRPTFAKAGARLSMNVSVGPGGLLAYSPTLSGSPIEAVNDKGRCRSPAEIRVGWAVLESGTVATVEGYIVTAGRGPQDFVDSEIYSTESDALRRAAQVRGKYGVVEVATITVRVEAQDGRLAFFDPVIE